MKSIYSLSQNDLNNLANELTQSHHSVKLLIHEIYRNHIDSVNHLSEISNVFKERLNDYDFSLPTIIKEQASSDGTVKLLIEFKDGKSVESVLLPFNKKYSLCVSSQVGCAMNCSFCFTATQGLLRNLEAHEIILQIITAKKYLKEKLHKDDPLTNIVFMGQGEPLHNFDNVKKALEIITDPKGLSIGKSNITLSTSGYIPGIKRIPELGGINIALSLHAPDQLKRSELIPITRRFPLDAVLAELDKLSLKEKQFIEYEYLLIDSLNDNQADIDNLVSLLKNRKALMNIIPFNEFPGSKYKRPSDEKIDWFKKKLVDHNIRVMVRKTKGDDILAACGQLKS